jgi:tRNA(Ile)-lysidine synthase TilS/MesJ
MEHRPVTAAAATACLRDLAGSLRRFDELVPTVDLELREQAEWWTQMIRAVCARITVVGSTFVEAQLTPAAYRHGLARRAARGGAS